MTNREIAAKIVKGITGEYGPDVAYEWDHWIPLLESELDKAEERGYNRACDAYEVDSRGRD